MRVDLRTVWVVCCIFILVTADPTVTSLTAAPTWQQTAHHPGRRSGRGNSNTNSVGSVTLSGSSSRPVQPIKPLLDLSAAAGEGASGVPMPLHPVFDQAAPRNVSSLAGSTAYLHCLVHNLGNKSVSWIRQRDLHILTVGRYTYTTDQRYEVIHSPDSQDWILKISYAQVRDSGTYECQVSTKPVRSYLVHLNVFATPRASIVGAPDMHVDKGSTINLTCVVTHSQDPPAYVFWYHNGEVVNYDSPRGGITVVTERGNTTRGYLLIQDAQPSDTGNYSCVPSNTALTSLTVHVLNGETPAAMQTSGGATVFYLPGSLFSSLPGSLYHHHHLLLLLLLLLLLVLQPWEPPVSAPVGVGGL